MKTRENRQYSPKCSNFPLSVRKTLWFGADILGDPLKALAWLAKEHTRRGRTLVAGTTILLGSVVQTQWLTPSADSEVVVEVDFTKLGRCHACFS